MKNIKNETYKGYAVKVFAKFEESTTAYMYTDTIYDSVSLLAYAQRFGDEYFRHDDIIEMKRDQRVEMYDEVNKKIESMMENIKKNIDKVVREKEMTDGLPESLLKEIRAQEATDHYMNLITTATQESGEAIGNALKSILERIEKASSVKDSIASTGISVDVPTDEVLSNLASKWDELSDENKAVIGVNVAGRYNLRYLLVLLNELSEKD